MYVADVRQRDWDEYEERLTFALNTAQDRVREETPFYLVHGWDARNTLETMLPVVNTRRRDSGPRRWRYRIQSHYQRARNQVNENLRAASQARVQAQNEEVVGHEIQPGSRVWLYLDRGERGVCQEIGPPLARTVQSPGTSRRSCSTFTRYRIQTIPNHAHLQAQARQRVPRST